MQNNTYTAEKLIKIRNIIQKMNSIHHLKFFEIIKNHKLTYSENRNGIFFNMNLLNDEIIANIEDYIKYINAQESNLNETEALKKNLGKEFFKDNKDKKENIVYHNV